MTATSSIKRLWLAVLCLLMTSASGFALMWESLSYNFIILTTQDRLESIRSGFAEFKIAQRAGLRPVPECGMDLELPSMLSHIVGPVYFGGPWLPMSSAKALRRFEFDPWVHTGWTTLADVQPPLATTEYHQVVIRLMRIYGSWKNEANTRILKPLSGPEDPGFFTVIEWQMNRSQR